MEPAISQKMPKYGLSIAAAIYDLAENKRVQPKAKLIAEFAGCSERSARNSLERLEDLGLVETDNKPGFTRQIFFCLTNDGYALKPHFNQKAA